MVRRASGPWRRVSFEELIDLVLLVRRSIVKRRVPDVHARLPIAPGLRSIRTNDRGIGLQSVSLDAMWRGRVNHSAVAMEWLLWQEHQLQAEAWSNMSEDEDQQHDMMAESYDDYAENHHPLYRHRIKDARNNGEHHVPRTRNSVDGYDPETNTVYEFYSTEGEPMPSSYTIKRSATKKFTMMTTQACTRGPASMASTRPVIPPSSRSPKPPTCHRTSVWPNVHSCHRPTSSIQSCRSSLRRS